MAGEREYLPQNRSYQTLSSIPKEGKDYNMFKFYIELEEQMFSFFSTQKTADQQEEFIKTILSTYATHKEQKHYSQYLVDLLVYYLLIRPKQAETTINILSVLILNNENQRSFINETIKNNICLLSKFLGNLFFVKDVLYSQGIIEKGINYYEKRKDTIFSIYPRGSLEFILKENDVDSLKEFIQQNNIQKDQKLSHQNKFILIYYINSYRYISCRVKHLDLCCYYSSYECFQFLQTNGFQYGNNINIFSVAGGNLSIIHALEQNGISYDSCLEISVKYHQLDVTEWLLTNYKCEIISLTETLQFFEYKTLLFMFLNGIDINKGVYAPLFALCQKKEVNTELIHYFIEHGADINKVDENDQGYIMSPLLSLCRQNDIDVELIKYFIEHGADVNQDGKYCCKRVTIMTPLILLCRQKEVNVDLIKYFIEHGADINKGFKDDRLDTTITPLLSLCQQKEVNVDLIKYFIEHGADINKGNPLHVLYEQKEVHSELIQYFIEHGAINQGSTIT